MGHRLLDIILLLVLIWTGAQWPPKALAQVSEEDAQAVLSAMAEADMVQEVTPSWKKKRSEGFTGGQWDSRVAISELGRMDSLNRLKIKSPYFSARGRWQNTREGETIQALSAALNFGSLQIRAGGLGLTAGYGLLLSSPGRSGGLAAGQALQPQRNRLKGWATAPDNRSSLGMGFSWAPRGWSIMGLHGRQDEAREGTTIKAVCVGKTLGRFNVGTAVMEMAGQRGLSLSGGFSEGGRHLGFEWALWGRKGQSTKQGVWLVSLNTPLMWGAVLGVQWAASNGSAGPVMGVRPWVLDAWAGAGWAVRLSTRKLKSWRLKLLWAQSRGHDWVGAHQSQSKQFIDILVLGKPWLQGELSLRWHQRIRCWEAWSEDHPWLPPALVKEDERQGFTLRWKFVNPGRVWTYSLRSLGRQGATTNGRRTLFSVRHRRTLAGKTSFLVSFQTAWGAAVDLVTASSPMRGVLLPRHWGHWSSEISAGLEFPLWGMKLMAAVARREPAAGEDRQPDVGIWAGARAQR